MEKLYYILFKVQRGGVSPNYPDDRKYIGKEISHFPKTSYLGENDCRPLFISIKRIGRERFTKTILKYCKNEEELNKEYDKIVTEKFCRNNHHVFNTMPDHKLKNRPYKRTKKHRKKMSKAKKNPKNLWVGDPNFNYKQYHEMYTDYYKKILKQREKEGVDSDIPDVL